MVGTAFVEAEFKGKGNAYGRKKKEAKVKVEDPPDPQIPPGEDPPAEDPPAEDPPAEDPPAEDPPAEDPPAEDPPAELESLLREVDRCLG